MLSFQNIMGGKNPLDDPEDDENPDGGKKPEPTQIVSWQDALVILVIIAAIVGGYQYYQYTKRESEEIFARCALLYDGGDLVAARDCYESTWDLSYAPADKDSLRVVRLGEIEDIKVAQEFVLETVQAALSAGDSAKAIEEAQKMTSPLLLSEEDAGLWKEISGSLAVLRSETSEFPSDSLSR